MFLDGKYILRKSSSSWSSFLKALFLILHISYLNTSILIFANDTTLYFKCEQPPDLWKQLELASELESDPRDAIDWDMKLLVDFSDLKNATCFV